MKSKKKKRLLILIGILMVCLLPISFLSKVLVPWAEELGEVTTEAGAAPPGDATVTDAANDPAIDVGRTLLGIQNGSVKYTDLSVEQAVQVVKAILCSKEDFAWFCSLDDSQAKKIFSVDKRRIQFEFETLMKDNTDMSFVKDMSVEDYDKFFGTTEGKSVISTVMNGKTVDATAAADGGFNMNITSCAPGHEGILQILPLGKHYVHCIEGGHYVSGSNKPPYGWMEVNGSKFYLMCGNDNKEINSFFAFSTKSIEAEEWEISVAFPSATQMYFDYYWTKKGGAQPSNEVPDRDFHDALGKLMEGVGSTSSYNGKSYAYPGSWNDVIRSERYKVFDADTGAELNSSSLLEMSVVDGQQITHKLRFETGTSYFGTTITVPQGTVFHYYQGANQYDVVGGQRVTVPNGTIGYFYAPLSTNGVIAAETVSAGWYVETTYRFECKGKPVQISTGKRLPVQQLLCPITKQPSLNFSIKAATTSHVALKKSSSNPNCSNNNPLYDLAGTQYTVYNQDGTPATTIAGTPAILTCKSDGTTNMLEMSIGSYKVKETKVGKGYLLNKNEIPITLTADNTVDNPLVINTTDQPVADPISVILKKENDKNVAIKGAVYCIEYYPGIQTYSESEVQTKHTGSVSKWYFETDANGEVSFDLSPTASGYISSPFYTNHFGGRTIPLGTVIMYEKKAPENYTKSSTHWVFQVRQEGSGGEAWLYGMEGGTEKRYDDGTTVSDTNAPKFTDTYIPVNLTVQKKNGNPTPQQGSTGDVTLEGAVFGLYVKRDIVDESTGETKVKAENYSVDTPLTHSDGTPVIDPTTGKQVIAKAGTAKAIRISTVTGKDGKISFNGLFPAKNADDYYVVELCAPKDFYRDKAEHPVDLRDNRTDAEKSDVNYTALSKHLDVTNQPIMQPIHVKKYVPVKGGNTTKIEPLNGAGFSVYLISSLKGDISACKVTNADGSVSYNFKSYDFSNETGEVVTDDGERVLVTGSGDNDDGEVTSIDLMPGTYVIVETKTPEGYETVDPMVVTLPRYRKDSAGNFVLDANGDPKIYATTSVSPTDMQIEKYLKINKKDKSTNEFVLQNKAKFSIWDISGADSSEYSKDPKTYGKQVTQQRQTENGYTDVSIFETNDEGFLLLFEAFKYGEYTIVEEEAPTGYDKDDNITFSVRQDGIYLWARNQWVKAETYSNKVGDTEYDFWEVNFYDAPFSLEIAKADWETGDWVPNAELTIYKAMDKAGHIAIGEDGKPVVLVARDESGKDVEAVWVTSAGIKRFDKVPSGWYVIRETKTPTQEGYATCPDRVVYVGNDETIAPNGKMTISGDETVYFSFTYDDDGVTIANVPEYEADTKNGKVALYDKPITVEISKIDAATEKELPGAVLTLYRVDEDEDTVIETWTSTKTSHVVKYLTPGRYKLHEDTVPLGYYTTENTIEFDVSNTEEIQKCVMVNHPIEVTFDKQSVNLGGTSLPGATLALYRISEGPAFATATDATASDASNSDATVSDASNSDADGLQLVKRWVTDGKPYTIKYLTPGDYRLIEEKTPEGYTTAASIDFSISDQKAAEAVVMYDEPIKCYVQIFKHGEMLTKTEIVECEYGKYTKFKWEDAPMSQISFDVYDENDNLVDTIVTNENGTGVSTDLAFGSYKIKERVPDGWIDKHVVYNVKFTWLQGMTETNLTASVTVNNESCNTQVNINKVGEEAVLNSKGEYEYVEKPLKGVLFGIYAKDAIKDYSGKEIAAADTCVGYAVTDSNGVASCDSKLVRGEYYYKELKTAGPQYVMDEDLHPFTLILANSKISTFNVNETLPIKNVLARGNIKVLKVNKDGRAPLAGAEFDVFNADGKIVDHLVTGADGTAMTKVLPYGKYSLRETKAPTGFVLSKATFDTEIIANGDVPLLEITNSTITKLGSKGIFIVVGLAVIFAGLVTVICFKLRRK
ncbi:MAG TPA: hypothetical protein DEF65_11055 [Lachnospiraceae bacterium]|nr:hypothetical protein [Lachnospiraceae bacterium]